MPCKEDRRNTLPDLLGFIKKSKDHAQDLKKKVDDEIRKLGTPPAKIKEDMDGLKKFIKERLEKILNRAAVDMETKINDLWQHATQDSNVKHDKAPDATPDTNVCVKLAGDKFLGAEFGSITEEIMAKRYVGRER